VRSRDKKTTTGDHAVNGDHAAPGPGQPEPAPPPAAANGQAPEPALAAGSQPPAAVRKGRSHGLKNWRVRSRLLLLIAIPTVTAVILGGIRITSSVQTALAYQRVLQLANTTSDVSTLAQQLQNERDQTVYYIAEGAHGGRAVMTTVPGGQGLAVVQQQTRNTNQAATAVRADLNKVVGGSFSTLTKQEAAAALADLANLASLRQAATGTKLPALVVVQKYSNMISDLLVLEDATVQGSSDASLSQTVRVLGFVSRMKEDASQQRAILAAALIQGGLDPASRAALVAAQSDQAANLSSFNLSATNAQRTAFQGSVSGSLDPLASSEEAQALSLGTSLKNDPTTADDWYGAMTNEINSQLGSVERAQTGAIIARTVVLRNQAIEYAIIVALIVLLVLALAVFATVVVARSMVRPLRRLRAGALEVAGVRLPETVRRMSEAEGAAAPLDIEPIDVDSTDEIGEVARAFDQVHREALRLASNEAALRGNVNAMFVNLSRRSQSLVERQIRLIDDLEQGEQDPERLSNLFQMDHLATRMRRNSENLLVLAGHEVSRRWTQSVPLVDVLRAAVSEIEQYERVTLNVQPGISVRGQAVNDVVHLIAELAENASSFSAADTPVKVAGHLLNSGGVLLDITDQGVGMGAEEMAHANWRLDNPPVVDVAVSRRMGLFVVARLAARHGIRVRLRPGSAGGLTALVWLPDEVITHDAAGVGVGASPGALLSDAPGQRGAADGGSDLAAFTTPEWPVDPASDGRAAAAQAVSAARTPRFAPLRPELGDTAAFAALGTDEESPAAAAPSGFDATSGPDFDLAPGPGRDQGAPFDTAPAPFDSVPAPLDSAPAPLDSAPAPFDSVPEPFDSAPAPFAGAPAPFDNSAAPFDTVSGPMSPPASDLQPADATPTPDLSSASALAGDALSSSGPLSGLDADGEDGPAPARSAPNELPFRIPQNHTAKREVVVPPAAGAAEEHRLPIFESVESDWFRRGRHGAGRTGQPAAAVVATGATGGWSSPADEGWRAAEAASAPTSGGITLSGLPKRVPRANLVPGAVGLDAPAPAAPVAARSAAQARERLASFQRGAREGRAAALDPEQSGSDEDDGAS
jgi:signal transduction histidine kinase